MGREEGNGKPWPLEAPHLSVVKAVVPVPPVKSSQCPTMDSLQQIQTCSGLNESTVLWGGAVHPHKSNLRSQFSSLNWQDFSSVSHRSGPGPSTSNYCYDFWTNGQRLCV